MKKFLLLFGLCLTLASISHAQSCTGSGTATVCTATSAAPNAVQAALNVAPAGSTVIAPCDLANGGRTPWSTGISDSGGHKIRGCGSPRIIARDNGTDLQTTPSSFPATMTFHLIWYSYGFSASSITPGQTLSIFLSGGDSAASQDPMISVKGTVTSITPGAQTCLLNATAAVQANTPCNDILVMNITSAVGNTSSIPTAGANHRWEVVTVVPTSATTTLINNSSNPMFNITENTSFHSEITGFYIVPGSIQQRIVNVNYTNGGQAVLIHNNYFRGDAIDLPAPSNGDRTMIENTTTRGVVWNNTFESTTGIGTNRYNISSMAAYVVKDNSNNINAWASPSFWGMNDTTGQNNGYCESNDIHNMGSSCDGDDNARTVVRYNFLDNSSVASHGADSSHIGQRTNEIYDNIFWSDRYSDHTTFNMPRNFYVRGGSYVFHDNYVSSNTGSDFGHPTNIDNTVMSLQRSSGTAHCWGANGSPVTQYYPAIRQVGYGNVTNSGTMNYPPDGCTNCKFDSQYGVYVGDKEPAYIWNNNNVSTPLGQVGTSDWGITTKPSGCQCSTCTPPIADPSPGSTYASSSQYITILTTAGTVADVFNNGTPKPSYTPFTMPHPLTGASGSPTMTASLVVIPSQHSGNILINLTGINTTWTSGTTFSITPLTGTNLISQTINASLQTGTITVKTGSTTGSFTISDSTDGATVVIAVSTPSFTISPTSGEASSVGCTTACQGTISFVGTNTVWANPDQPVTGLFTVSGGTGASLGTITIISNTQAQATLTWGSAVATETLTDTSSGLTKSFSVISSGTCTTPLIINGYTTCGHAYVDVASGTTATVNVTPSAGNGVVVIASFCAGPTNCANSPSQQVVISDNINNPEPCFTLSPNSPFAYANPAVPDFETITFSYCPSIPSGITSLTLTTGAPVAFLQLDEIEIKAGQIAPTNYYESVDNENDSGPVANQLATIPTSGSTVNATDFVIGMLANCGGSIPGIVGAPYTGIIVNPPPTNGHIVEALGTTSVGIQTATMSWTTGSTSAKCGLGTAGINNTWFGIIVPLSSVAISGTPVSNLSPLIMNFPTVNLGSSYINSGTLTNSGNALLTWTINPLTSPYTFVGTGGNPCPTSGSLAAGATCNFNVTFTPTTVGTFGANLTFVDNAPGSPHIVALTGLGQGLAVPTQIFANSLAGCKSLITAWCYTTDGHTYVNVCNPVCTGFKPQTFSGMTTVN